MATTATEIQALYVAYFNRPADVLGLQFWLDRANASPAGADSVANEFANSDEYRSLYANKTSAEIVDAIYMNLFGRHAEAEGLVYWANKLNKGELNIGNVARIISTSAQNEDLVAITAKVSAAEQFTASLTDAAEIIGYSGDAANAIAKTWLAGVKDDATLAAATTDTALQAVSDAAVAAHDGVVNAGKNLVLTKTVDSGAAFTGGAGVDTFTGIIDNDGTTNNSTFTALDDLKGGAGVDVLNLDIIDDNGAGLPAVTLTSIETVNIRSAVNLTADLSAQADVATINVTKGAVLNLTASSTAAVNVSGATGAVDVNGGASQNIVAEGANVTSGTAGTAAHDTKGDVSISLTKAAGNDVVVTGGANVSVVTTGGTTGNTIDIGQTGTQQATGTIKVSATGAAYDKAGASNQAGTISVKGGTSIEVNQVAYAATTDAGTDTTTVTTHTQGNVVADGNGTATSVVVNQSKAVTAKDAVTAVAGVHQAATYTFGVLLTGQTVTVGGLTFTAIKDLTGAEVATAFASLADGAVQGAGKVANGSYSGTFAADWTSGAASGATVTFTALDALTAAASALNPLVAQGTGSATVVQPTAGSTVAGVTNVDAVTGVAGIAYGTVTITDSGTTDKIASVTLNGYAASTIASEALTTLNLTNSKSTLAITQTTQKTLDLTVNGLASGAGVSNGTYETVNLHVAGASTFAATAAAAKSLVVDGSAVADISTGSTLSALETVKVNGSAGLNLGTNGSGTIKSIDTTGTTGTVTAAINGTVGTYTGGAGVDNVTVVASASITKAINLGAGDDSLTFTGTNVPTATGTIDGGTGTNTLVLSAADANTLSGNANFEAAISNFQKLSIGAVASGATSTVDLSNLDDINYVISANGGGATAEVQTFTVTAGTAAAVAEKQTFTVTAATAGGTLTVGGVNVVLGGATTQDNVGAAIVAQKAAIIAANATIADVTYAAGVVTITYTTAAGNVAALGGMSDDNANTGATFGAVADNAVAFDSNAGSMTVGGVNVALTAGMTVDQVGAAIAAAQTAIKGGVATVDTVTYNAATDTVTVTYLSTAGNVGNIAVVDAAATGATFGAVTEATAGVGAVGGVALTVNKMANAGTLEITAAGTGVTVGMTDATGTADSLNLKIANAGSINVGTISTAGVESIALALDDTSSKAADITAVHTVSIADTSLTSIVLTGDAGGILTTNSNKVATIDGSALTLSLTAGSLTTATVAATITGGAGDDILTANHTGDKLIGGAGDDVLKVGGAGAVFANGVTLTGGDGADTFDISGAQAVGTVNDYATITDFSAGDMLKLAAANIKFVAASVTTGGTAVFQDLVNKVILESDINEAGWFQYQGDTYVVEHRSLSNATSFVNGLDNIVKIAGTVDLSNVASYSTSADTLLIIG